MIRKLKTEKYRGYELHFFVGPQSGLVTGYAKFSGTVHEVVRGTSKIAVAASLKDYIDKSY